MPSKKMPPIIDELTGELVVLRNFLQVDITAEYVGWLNDPLVVRFSNQRFRRHTQSSCKEYVASFKGSPHHFLKIIRRDNDQMVGTMTAYISIHHGTVDMGIMVGCRSSWGKGIGQDAWNTLLKFLLKMPQVRKVTAGAMSCNLPMLRIMEKSGMSLEAVRPAQEMLDGSPRDMVFFGKFSDEL